MNNLNNKTNKTFKPSKTFKSNANINSKKYKLLQESYNSNPEVFWEQKAKELISWKKDFTKVLNKTKAPFYSWFENGLLNVSYNCLDVNLPQNANKTALIFERNDGTSEEITYQSLYERVCKFANGLKSIGVKRGDKVSIYMPMIPDTIVAMQACARIGAIHSVIFTGFSPNALAFRIADVDAKVVITVDESLRGEKRPALKENLDAALKYKECKKVKKVIVLKNSGADINFVENRDIWWHDFVKDQSDFCEPEWVPAEAPLFILYTSGSTGKPKGVVHSSAGYLLGGIFSMQCVFDLKPDEDIYWCTADFGWVTGHSYVAYAPLALGATQLVYEGLPSYPDNSRYWQIIEKHKVSIFYASPTALRSLRKKGENLPKDFDLSSLRLLGSVGEPISPQVWLWFYKMVGNSNCPIVDTWWQTETGSVAIAPIPGVIPTKPGSCTLPLPGIVAEIIDEKTGKKTEPNINGLLIIKEPFPSLFRNVWHNDSLMLEKYYPESLDHKYYLTGDTAHYDEDGYIWITGRIDDVINISGQRYSTAEIEATLMANGNVAENAVIGIPHPIKGETVVAFVVLKNNNLNSDEDVENLTLNLKQWIADSINKTVIPEKIYFIKGLPKTHSGKTMRNILRLVAENKEITIDTSALTNREVLDELKSL